MFVVGMKSHSVDSLTDWLSDSNALGLIASACYCLIV